MLVLLGIGFVAGVVTAISPCVLPVLPILLAGSASGSSRRPFAIVAGLVASFSAFLLAGAWLLDALGLPQDSLRTAALVLLVVAGVGVAVPRVAELIERPLLRLGRRRPGDLGSGFLLGASLGVVFVPCAGPVLAAIAVVAATRSVGVDTVFLTLAYALGAAVPMLVAALAGRRGARALRAHGPVLRAVLGAVIVATAAAIWLDADQRLTTALPGYAASIQRSVESSSRLARLTGAGELLDSGPAPELRGLTGWVNSGPLTMAGLRGKVVLVDFWTYSCINCLRTLPHVEGWAQEYGRAGLVVLGVHTPEFAFERVPSNVRTAVGRLGVRYPVAQDNGYATWKAFGTAGWPTEYLIDRRGHIRRVHVGEGEYPATERAIRALLAEVGDGLPVSARLPDPTPREPTTPETYLGSARLDVNYVGGDIRPGVAARYRLPGGSTLLPNSFAYGGVWRVLAERIVAGPDARLRLHFRARDVYLVAAGRGRVTVLVDGRVRPRLTVSGIARLHTLLRYPKLADGVLELRFTPGLAAYTLTFG